MKWRDTTGLTLAVLVFLGIGSQSIARWFATRSLSQYVSGNPSLLGSVHWDPVRHAWTCYQWKIEPEGGESIQAERSTLYIDSREFLRRNLVIDSARVDGMIIRVPSDERTSEDSLVKIDSAFPMFAVDAWVDGSLNQYRSEVLSAVQRRDLRRRELQQDLERVQRRCLALKAATTPNPLRDRIDMQEVQREIANLLQALAEEKIRVRESDRELMSSTQRMREGWRDEVGRSIEQALPDKSHMVSKIAEHYIAAYWESRRILLSYAAASAMPLQDRGTVGRGREIAISGLPGNYLKIRSANLTGYIEATEWGPIRFQAAIARWGDESQANNPKSDWQFELPNTPLPTRVEAHVERAVQEDGWRVTWEDLADSRQTRSGHLLATSQTKQVQVSIPVDFLVAMEPTSNAIVFGGAPEWQTAWSDALGGFQGRELVANLPFIAPESPGIAHRWRCGTPEIEAGSLAIFSQVWDKALTNYIADASARVQPRVGGLCLAMELFRTQGWVEGLQDHSTKIAEMERETVSLRDNWDSRGKHSERMARMRGAEEDF